MGKINSSSSLDADTRRAIQAALDKSLDTTVTSALGGDLTGTIGAAQIASGIIVDADVSGSAGIVDTKLATIATANKVSASALNVVGATDIGAALADGDILPVYDLSATANRGSALSRIATWLFAKVSSHVTMTSGGVATIAAGVITNAMLNTAAGAPGGAWQSYTPVLTASTTNPTLGTGSVSTGAYLQIGKTVFFRAYIKFGTAGTAAGTGTYRISLPVNAIADIVGFSPGSAVLNDSGVRYTRTLEIGAAGYVEMYSSVAGASVAVTNAVPFAWGVSDFMRVTGVYQAA